MPLNAFKFRRRPRLSRCLLLFVLFQPLTVIGWGQAPPAQTILSPMTAPAVPDEPGQNPPPLVTTSQLRSNESTLHKRVQDVNSMALAREEIRRAFIKQDYQRVLSLSHEMRQRFNLDESNDFYIVAAQLRLNDRKALEDGQRVFPRLGDRPPQLPAVLPSIEPKISSPAAGAGSTPAVTPEPVAPDAAPTPTVVETAPGEGRLVPAQPATGANAGQPDSAEAGKDDRMIASAVTPAPRPAEPLRVIQPAPAPSGTNLVERIFLVLVLAALLALVSLYLFVMRRRTEEPEPDLATTLSGLTFTQDTGDPSPAQRTSQPVSDWKAPSSGAVEPSTEIREFDEDLFDEESMQSSIQRQPVVVERTQTLALPVDVPDDLFAVTQPEHPLAPPAEQPAPSVPDKELVFEGLDLSEPTSGRQTSPMTDDKPLDLYAEDPFATQRVDRSTVDFDDLPQSAVGPSEWAKSDDSISMDFAGSPSAPTAAGETAVQTGADAAEADYPLSAVGPEAADTQVDQPRAESSGQPEQTVSPSARTKTSWDGKEEQTLGMSPAEIDEARADLPGVDTDDMAHLQAFHEDDTIDLHHASTPDPDSTIPSGQATFSESTSAGAPLPDEPGLMDAPTASSPPPIVSPQPETAEGEDLFDREQRLGLDCFERKDWASAVHHLSIAAALRPDQMQIKEMLREARRRRKTHS